MLELALLIALFANIVLGVGWLRAAGENEREDRTRHLIIYGSDFAAHSARQRQAAAERIVKGGLN